MLVNSPNVAPLEMLLLPMFCMLPTSNVDPSQGGFKYEWEVNLRLRQRPSQDLPTISADVDPECPRKLGTRTIKLSEDAQIRRTASRANAEAKLEQTEAFSL